MDLWESVREKLGEKEVKLLLDEAKVGTMNKQTLHNIARLLGGAVLGGHKLRTEKGFGWNSYPQEMRDILTDWANEKEFHTLNSEMTLKNPAYGRH